MFAARDQENLVHGHQAAAAAKPLNQGTKQLAPKTPGNKTAKTPIRVPLNDENGPTGFGGGKKTLGKGNENSIFGTKQGGALDGKAFITPMGPRNRAPLGVKTTNAKAKAFQTPAPAAIGGQLGNINQRSVSVQKPKPKVSHPETTKLEDILADKEALDEREIEYMPPKAKDLPDYPDDFLPIPDPPVLHGPDVLEGWFDHYANKSDAGGLSYIQRKELEEKETNEYLDKKGEAEMLLAADSTPMSCLCDEECWGAECKESVARRKAAQETYRKTITALESKYLAKFTKSAERKGPSMRTSKAAATALSQAKRPPASGTKPAVKASGPSKKPGFIPPLGNKKPAPPNMSEKRHAAAAAASKTTMGYSKGRAASAAMRKTVMPGNNSPEREMGPDYKLAPAVFIQRYGVPKFGTQKWLECKSSGCFDENTEVHEDLGAKVTAENDGLAKYFKEEAEKEFVLEL
ncbi:MAG: hypothetical protein LQ348_002080 [Seirophora lacunosa]|nr:MAG: hypothetical protein LQ348_002080 [Seirophora lacunosa]